jgi:hypothetical protein
MTNCDRYLTLGLAICMILAAGVATAADRAADALNEQCAANFVRVPMDRITAQLGNTHRVRITFAENVKKDTSVTFTERGKTLRYVLYTILTPQNLTFQASGDEIIIGPARRTR